MSDMKTIENDGDVDAFLNCVENLKRAADTRLVVDMMARVTGKPAKMWGDAIIGFDRFEYKRRDGSQHAYMMVGVSPRKASVTVYIMPGFNGYKDQLAKLGKHKHSSSCLYITSLANVDFVVLEEIVSDSYKVMQARNAG
ncbi:MAG: hypothetical protein ACI861_001702 [Paracoccaceae bacterium]